MVRTPSYFEEIHPKKGQSVIYQIDLGLIYSYTFAFFNALTAFAGLEDYSSTYPL